MGEDLSLFRAEFNKSIRMETRPEHLTSDSGVLALREALDKLRMSEWLEEHLKDDRDENLITYSLAELVRTSVLLLALGYRDQDDADLLWKDPALRLAVSERKGITPLAHIDRPEGAPRPTNPVQPEGLASQPTLSRLDTRLASAENRVTLRHSLMEGSARRINAVRGHRFRNLTIDVDSLPIEVHGHQPEAEYNGHYHATIYHPILATVGETGDILDLDLRRGRAHTAEGATDFILDVLARAEESICQVAAVRIDAGFPEEGLLSALEGRSTPYVSREKKNPVLERMAEPYLRRPPGRRPAEPRTWFYELTYKAEKWSRSRRVVLVVMEEKDDLYLKHFWLITNYAAENMSGEKLLEMYRKRGAAEGYMGELMSVLSPALSSSPRPKSNYRGEVPSAVSDSVDALAQNEVRLLLNALAYNLMHVTRCLIAEATGEGWSLQRFREQLLKVPARVLLHGKRATFVIGQRAAGLWKLLWQKLERLEFAVPAS